MRRVLPFSALNAATLEQTARFLAANFLAAEPLAAWLHHLNMLTLDDLIHVVNDVIQGPADHHLSLVFFDEDAELIGAWLVQRLDGDAAGSLPATSPGVIAIGELLEALHPLAAGPQSGPQYELLMCALHPRYRGQQQATTIFQLGFELCRGEGITQIWGRATNAVSERAFLSDASAVLRQTIDLEDFQSSGGEHPFRGIEAWTREQFGISTRRAALILRRLPEGSDLGDVSEDEFQAASHKVGDWLTQYRRNIETLPVVPPKEPGSFKAQFSSEPPQEGQSLADTWASCEQKIPDWLTHWNHPGFLAYFGVTSSHPGVIAEMMSAGLNQVGMLWLTSPALTELETTMVDWLRQMMGLPQNFQGITYDTASISTLHAMAAARHRVAPDIRARGLSQEKPLTLYISEQAHSSVEKAAITLGIGLNHVRKIPVDEHFALDAGALRQQIELDRSRGCRPFMVVATAGSTSTTSIDPLHPIADLCEEFKLWLHVDAAYGGAALLLEEKRYLFQGIERADSIVVNGHKWLLMPFECSVILCRSMRELKEAFQLVPAYLETNVDEKVENLMDYGVQLGRRFRGLKMWFVMQTFGQRGLARRIRFHCTLAREWSAWIDGHSQLQRMAPVPLSVVCFRYAAGASEADNTRINQAIYQGLLQDGSFFISHTQLQGLYTLRVAFGNLQTRRHHLLALQEKIEELIGGAL